MVDLYLFMPTGVMHDIAFGKAGFGEEVLVEAGEEEEKAEGAQEEEEIELGWWKRRKLGVQRLKEDYQLIEARFYTHIYKKYNILPENRHQGVANLTPQQQNQPTFEFVFGIRRVLVEKITKANLQKFPFLFFWDFTVLCITVCTAELAVVLNGVTGVGDMGTAGQLLAFVMGLGGLVTALASLWGDNREKKIKAH